MAKNQEKEVQWKEVVEVAADLAGAPKKQLEADADAIDKSLKKILTERQPKRDGDVLKVYTPFGAYMSTRLPEAVVTDANGNRFTRSSRCAVNIGIPRDYIDAANIGLADKVEEKEAKNA